VSDRAAQDVLLEHLDEAHRGRVTGRLDAVEIDVYVQGGTILAAEANDDRQLLLRRLVLDGAIDEHRARHLETLGGDQRGVGPLLDQLPEKSSLERALRDRFHDNLARFCGAPSATFTPLPVVFADNLQPAVDARSLVGDSRNRWLASRNLRPDDVFRIGMAPPANARSQRVVELINAGLTSLPQLLELLPEEPTLALALLSEMVELEQLDLPRLDPPGAAPDEVATETASTRAPPAAAREGALPSMPMVDVGVIGAARDASLPADWHRSTLPPGPSIAAEVAAAIALENSAEKPTGSGSAARKRQEPVVGAPRTPPPSTTPSVAPSTAPSVAAMPSIPSMPAMPVPASRPSGKPTRPADPPAPAPAKPAAKPAPLTKAKDTVVPVSDDDEEAVLDAKTVISVLLGASAVALLCGLAAWAYFS
jgi:hypothetical protein